jgi:type I restriction enzyme, S subunit
MMEGWKQITIGDLGKVVTGNTPPKKDPANYGGEYPFIKPTDMEIDRRHVTEWEENYSEKAFSRYHRSYIPPKATGVVTIGTVGEKLFQADRWCFTNQSVNVVIPHKEFFDPDFVYYVLKVNLPKVENANPGTASGRHHVSKSNFCAIKILVPESKETQRKIASILSAYDDLIENNLKRIKLLEEKAQLTYEEWFVRMKFPGHETSSFNKATGLPEGWEKKKIGDLCTVSGGGTPSKAISEYWDNGSITWFSPTDLSKSGSLIQLDSESKITGLGLQKSSAKVLQPNSFMMTSRATIGLFGIIDKPFSTNQGFINVTPNENFEKEYLIYNFKYNIQLFIKYATGATFLEISKSVFKKIKINWPTIPLIKSFNEIVSPIHKEMLSLTKQNQLLKEARDILLPRLMTGVIDVDHIQLENLQPTST